MFRKSTTTTVPDLFNTFTQNLEGARYTKFSDPGSWHNLFREHIISKLDEVPFRCLYSENMGRVNVPVRILIGMMILKEGFGWSDERLFEEAQFDILVMSSLGLTNVNDSVPCSSTYYYFRDALYKHYLETGEDLTGNVFKQLTKEQAKLFGVNGKFVRMDSKLIGSNICKSSRLQLVINVLQVFYKDICEKPGLTEKLTENDSQLLEELMRRRSGNIVYELDNDQRETKLEDLGYLLYRLQELYNEDDSNKYHLITRILCEQYHIEDKKIRLKEVKEIQADSLQSPHDEDAAFRNKGGKKVQGYSVNLTETCNEDELNLITDVNVEKATAADNDFVQESIERSQEVIGHIDHLNTDGAYQSKENNQFAEKNQTKLILSGIQGKKGKYDFEVTPEFDVKVTNTHTGKIFDAEHYKEGKWKIRDNGKIKYFSYAFILSYFNRLNIENIPQVEKNRRNNVEASIFQLSYFTRNNKTRYRGLIQHQSWAYCRSMWINLVRIKNWIGEVCPNGNGNGKNYPILTKTGKLLTDLSTTYTQKAIFCVQFLLTILFGHNFLLQRFKKLFGYRMIFNISAC